MRIQRMITFKTGVKNSATPKAVPFTVLITLCISTFNIPQIQPKLKEHMVSFEWPYNNT